MCRGTFEVVFTFSVDRSRDRSQENLADLLVHRDLPRPIFFDSSPYQRVHSIDFNIHFITKMSFLQLVFFTTFLVFVDLFGTDARPHIDSLSSPVDASNPLKFAGHFNEKGEHVAGARFLQTSNMNTDTAHTAAYDYEAELYPHVVSFDAEKSNKESTGGGAFQIILSS